MSNTRLTVVMRKDLQFVEGLAISQGLHIGMLALQKNHNCKESIITLDEKQNDWVPSPYVSILAVHCYEDLMIIGEAANRALLKVHVLECLREGTYSSFCSSSLGIIFYSKGNYRP